jgi:hypothetical protein
MKMYQSIAIFVENTHAPPHIPRVKIKPNGNKNESKTINSKKKTGKAKHGAFPKVQDDCKESSVKSWAHYICTSRS